MKPSFVHYEKPTMALIFSPQSAEDAMQKMRQGIADGAEGFCIQTETLPPEERNPETYRAIFAVAENRPIYVTNYRHHSNENASDEEIAEGLLELARCGATVCDVMGDMFDRQPGEMTRDPKAVEKQKKLIADLHEAGVEVLMSSHVLKFTPAEQVLEIARRQQERGVDIVKIVTGAETMEQQLENLRITNLLKQELKVPFLFLSGGECGLHRRIGPMLGCCMYLCTPNGSTGVQPNLKDIIAYRENYPW